MSRDVGDGEKAAHHVVGWAFDARGRVQIRISEEGKDGLRSERLVALQLSEVPGAAAAFERLRSLLDARVSGRARETGPRRAP